jgi:hypothetical protein
MALMRSQCYSNIWNRMTVEPRLGNCLVTNSDVFLLLYCLEGFTAQ